MMEAGIVQAPRSPPMPALPSFLDLIHRVRIGDEDAATELVRQYEPEIRRAIRLRLTDPRLRRLLDSMDICQSVLGDFFVRAAAGQFDLEEPTQLLKLFVVMARNKLRNHADYQRAARRDHRRLDMAAGVGLDTVAGGIPSPSRIASGQELLREVRRQMTEEERYLAEQRALGRDWADLAAEVGGTPEGLRKRLARAVDRVARRLGLDEVNHA
jgi:RNA polymerase sigma-70 factor (ECF subfamily)